ncbi:hypothetical protein [uncultured Legionella sp.]|uniref:hypothetical protein n=1 Tax=uncultured Legionella sp. TaxID=210934 RepID=UPI0026062214|nr:hypothetical protein [uncultured Legionella sp.]
MAMLMHYPSKGFNESDLPFIKNSVPIEILTLDDGDHEFIVINRKADSHLNEPHTWGNNVIILDPWLRECYLLDEALSRSRQTNSVKIIFQPHTYTVENKGTISEGASSRWHKAHEPYDIFKLQSRATQPEEQIPWVTPAPPRNQERFLT